MERLTKKHYDGNGYYMACSEHCNKECLDCKEIDKIIDRLGTYEDTGVEPEEISDAVIAAKLMAKSKIVSCFGVDADHIRELVQADQDGRLVVLPCKVGDVVYGFHGEKTILQMVVKWIETCTNGWCIAVQYAQMAPRFYRFSDFGKTVFLTSEEAEKALEVEFGGADHGA